MKRNKTKRIKQKKTKRIKQKKTKKKYKSSPFLSIPIHLNSNDNGYSDLLHPRLLSYIYSQSKKGNNLIQTQFNKPFYSHEKSTLHLVAKSVKSWNQYPKWHEIQCTTRNSFIKSSPCSIGSNIKLFVKLKSNIQYAGLGIYIYALHKGIISKQQHKSFVKYLQKTFDKKPIRIHNEDVDWFHVKQA